MNQAETSIIIRTLNEEKYLPALLEAIGKQNCRDFEIVLVDSGSTDRTREIATPLTDKLLRIDSRDFTFGFSLNVGLAAASGKYAALVSAHTLPTDENWLAALIEPLRDEQTAMTYGRQFGWPDSKFSELLDLDRMYGSLRHVLRPPTFYANNANSAVRMDLWKQHQFDETLPGLEDIEWAKHWMERGYQVVYEPEAALYHIHDETWRQVRRRYYREHIAARAIGVKGTKQMLTGPAREVGYAFKDLGRVLWPFGNNGDRRLPRFKVSQEILLFRTNKAIGSFQGLRDGSVMPSPLAKDAALAIPSCKVVVVRGPGQAAIEEIKIGEVKPGDVLIKTAFAGISFADLQHLDGPEGNANGGGLKYPQVPGHEISGKVVALGTNVIHLSEGDSVAVESVPNCGTCEECSRSNWASCTGRSGFGEVGRNAGYAEYIVAPGRFVHLLPASLDIQRAVLCEEAAVALKGLDRLATCWGPEAGPRRCAIVGAASLGHFCARLLAYRGHSVTVFDQNPNLRRLFETSDIEASDDLDRLADFDVFVETSGDPENPVTLLDRSGPGANILLLGPSYDDRPVILGNIAASDKTLVTSVGRSSEDFQEALGILPKLDTAAYLERVYPLEDFTTGWESLRQGNHLKVILEVNNAS